MMGIFSLFAVPLGYVMQWIYNLVPSYFVAILLFTLAIRLLLFPLSINSQKNQADRARLAPRLERIQKKYANDRQKMAQKQQELYEKEGVKMTAGCLPMILQMLVLMSIIAVIYKPLTYVQRVPEAELNACVSAITAKLDAEKDKAEINRYAEESYYRELYLMQAIDTHRDDMIANLVEDCKKTKAEAIAIVEQIETTRDEFSIFGVSMLEVPSSYGIRPNWLWLIVLASGVSAFLSSMLSMRYSKASMPQDQQQMPGCSTNGMLYMMPIMSLVLSFTVPGGVAVYWTFSNLLAMVQTVVLNSMYNPAKIRAQAEAEYAERRRKKAEDKARLKAARLEEQAAWQREENEKRAAAKGDVTKKKSAATPATPAAQPTEDKAVTADAPAATKEEEESV